MKSQYSLKCRQHYFLIIWWVFVFVSSIWHWCNSYFVWLCGFHNEEFHVESYLMLLVFMLFPVLFSTVIPSVESPWTQWTPWIWTQWTFTMDSLDSLDKVHGHWTKPSESMVKVILSLGPLSSRYLIYRTLIYPSQLALHTILHLGQLALLIKSNLY